VCTKEREEFMILGIWLKKIYSLREGTVSRVWAFGGKRLYHSGKRIGDKRKRRKDPMSSHTQKGKIRGRLKNL